MVSNLMYPLLFFYTSDKKQTCYKNKTRVIWCQYCFVRQIFLQSFYIKKFCKKTEEILGTIKWTP